MKKQRVLAAEARSEIDLIWDLVTLILAREKEQHGSTMVQGKDGGSNCLKKQMGPFKLIRMQNVDEIINEYTKQYQFVKKKRPNVVPLQKPPQPPAKLPNTHLDARNNKLNTAKANNLAKAPIKNALNNKKETPTSTNQSKPMQNGNVTANKKTKNESDSFLAFLFAFAVPFSVGFD